MNELPITYRGAVYPWHCDHMDHMNVAHYVAKFDEATWNFFALFGLTSGYFRKERRGMAALRQALVYKRELLAGDTVFVRTRMIEVTEKIVRFEHVMCNGASGEIAATTELTATHMDTSARRTCPFPTETLARAQELMESHREFA